MKKQTTKVGVMSKTHEKFKGDVLLWRNYEEKIIGLVESNKPLADAFYDRGTTINLGNHEFDKITIGVRMPCEISKFHLVTEALRRLVDVEIEKEKKISSKRKGELG